MDLDGVAGSPLTCVADARSSRGQRGRSRGIGAACCRKLATDGFDVVVVYRSGVDEANEVVAGISACGGSAVAVQADVGDEADVVRLFEEIDRWRHDRGASLTALVNNAGVLGPTGAAGSLAAETSASSYQRCCLQRYGSRDAAAHMEPDAYEVACCAARAPRARRGALHSIHTPERGRRDVGIASYWAPTARRQTQSGTELTVDRVTAVGALR